MSEEKINLPVKRDVYAVIEKVLDGTTLREAVKECGFTPMTFNRELQADKDAAVTYARALEIKADLIADEIIHIADTAEDASKARNQIDSRKWVASKLYARRYGERIDLNVTQTIDVGITLQEARSRYISDTPSIIDAQAIDIIEEKPNEAFDKISNVAATPDIFK